MSWTNEIKAWIYLADRLEYKSGQNMEPGHYEWLYITVPQHHLLNRSE